MADSAVPRTYREDLPAKFTPIFGYKPKKSDMVTILGDHIYVLSANSETELQPMILTQYDFNGTEKILGCVPDAIGIGIYLDSICIITPTYVRLQSDNNANMRFIDYFGKFVTTGSLMYAQYANIVHIFDEFGEIVHTVELSSNAEVFDVEKLPAPGVGYRLYCRNLPKRVLRGNADVEQYYGEKRDVRGRRWKVDYEVLKCDEKVIGVFYKPYEIFGYQQMYYKTKDEIGIIIDGTNN